MGQKKSSSGVGAAEGRVAAGKSSWVKLGESVHPTLCALALRLVNEFAGRGAAAP